MTLAIHEHYCEPFIGSMVPGSAVASTNDNIPGTDLMVLGIRQHQDHIRVFPVFGPDAQRLVDLLYQTNGNNGLYYTADRHAYGVVTIRNNMIVAHTAQKNGIDRDNVIELFWHEVSAWLAHYQRIPIEWFHLFIGEVSFRFHYRDQDLLPLMLERVRQTPTHELKNM